MCACVSPSNSNSRPLPLSLCLQVFGDYYHFRHHSVAKRSLSGHSRTHALLQEEPQVGPLSAHFHPSPSRPGRSARQSASPPWYTSTGTDDDSLPSVTSQQASCVTPWEESMAVNGKQNHPEWFDTFVRICCVVHCTPTSSRPPFRTLSASHTPLTTALLCCSQLAWLGASSPHPHAAT